MVKETFTPMPRTGIMPQTRVTITCHNTASKAFCKKDVGIPLNSDPEKELKQMLKKLRAEYDVVKVETYDS